MRFSTEPDNDGESPTTGRSPTRHGARKKLQDFAHQTHGLITVAILAQGTHWAVADSQAFLVIFEIAWHAEFSATTPRPLFLHARGKKLAAPQGVPRRSPTLVLTGPYAA